MTILRAGIFETFERLVVAAKLDTFCTDRERANYCIYFQVSYPIRSLTTANKSLIAGRAQYRRGYRAGRSRLCYLIEPVAQSSLYRG